MVCFVQNSATGRGVLFCHPVQEHAVRKPAEHCYKKIHIFTAKTKAEQKSGGEQPEGAENDADYSA